MRKKLLLLFSMAVASLSAMAGDWTAPSLTFAEPQSGDSMYIYNVEGQRFLNMGNSWGSEATLSSEGLIFQLENHTDGEDATQIGWTILTCSGSKAGKYVFRVVDGTYGDCVFVDMGTQGHNYWDIMKQDNGYYHIHIIEADNAFGKGVRAEGEVGSEDYYDPWEHELFGWYGGDEGGLTAVKPTVTSDLANIGVDWQFVSLADYNIYSAKLNLYNMLNEAEKYEVSTTEAEAVYNNAAATIEEINAATAALRNEIIKKGASEDNPIDVTDYLVNPNFDNDVSGWTIDMTENKAGGGGYQTASYSNGDVTISKFIECWTWSQGVDGGLRNGSITQVIKNLPAGKYMLSVDCIAVNQSGNQIKGVQLFATGGEIDNYVDISTGDGKPEHFDVNFVSSGGDVTMGLRCVETCANWIAADNFKLAYKGMVDDPEKYALEQVIAQYEAKYPDMEAVKANGEIKAAYEAALENAKNATGDYQTVQAALIDAATDMQTSIGQYTTAKENIDDLESQIAEIDKNKGWQELSSELGDVYDLYSGKYEDETLVAEDVDVIPDTAAVIIRQFIANNCKAGDDVTILLRNPNFDRNFKGWDMTGAGVVWANWDAQGANNAEAAQNLEQPEGGLAERWHAKFTMSQTIANMPRGLYTLTCQGFNRHDNGEEDASAELYAVLPDGTEQSVNFASIDDYATEEKIYDNGAWSGDASRNGLWAPNSMSGSAWHFMNKKDGEHYDYQNSFDIIMAEQGDLTVGARCNYENQWVIFDNFKIYYMGSSANIYKPQIEKLIAQLQAIEEESVLTVEDQAINAVAIAAGEEAISTADEEASIAAIAALNAAVEASQKTAVLTTQLANDYEVIASYRMLDVTSTDTEFPAYLEDLASKLGDESFADDDEVQSCIDGLKSGFTKYVQFDHLAATEEEPADITPVIYNTKGVDMITQEASTNGWSITGTATSDGAAFEQYNQQNTNFYQTIYGLAPGYYRVKVLGFYRAGLPAAVADSLNAGLALQDNATLYAGSDSTLFKNIMSDAAVYTQNGGEGTAITIGELAYNLPNSMGQFEAATAMTEEDGVTPLYQNILQFKVEEGTESVDLGVTRTGYITNDWLIFTDWQLEYVGTTEPKDNPSTAIQSTKAADVLSTAIYGLDGTQKSHLTRGINLIKVTMADGTVRTNKVLVK